MIISPSLRLCSDSRLSLSHHSQHDVDLRPCSALLKFLQHLLTPCRPSARIMLPCPPFASGGPASPFPLAQEQDPTVAPGGPPLLNDNRLDATRLVHRRFPDGTRANCLGRLALPALDPAIPFLLETQMNLSSACCLRAHKPMPSHPSPRVPRAPAQ